jgi:hypothetical protein
MDNMGQATADNATGQLDLRRVLFELLVMCGMDRQLGRSGKVDTQGRPDAVAEANFYLYGRTGRPKPIRPVKPNRYKALWLIVGNVLFSAPIVLYFWWVNHEFLHEPLWLLVVVCVVVVGYQFFPPITEFEAELGDDKVFRTWLIILSEQVCRNSRLAVDAPDDPVSHGLLHIKSISSQRIVRRVTDYRVLCPDLWRKWQAKGLGLKLLNYVFSLFIYTSMIAVLFHGASWLNWWRLIGLGVVSTIVVIGRAQPNIASPPVLRTYLVKHLLDQIQVEATGASGVAATKASPCRSAALS